MLTSFSAILAAARLDAGIFYHQARQSVKCIIAFILKDNALSLGAKVTYASFLHYVWHNDSCFPGQDRLGRDMGMSTSRANEFIKELEKAGQIEITRRGQGKTNFYKLHFVVQKPRRSKS